MMNEFVKRVITSIILIACLGGAYLHSTILFSLLLVTIFLLIVVFEWSKLINGSFGFPFWLKSCVYPGLPIAGLFFLNYCYRSASILFPLYPVFIAWIADTCGYLVGKLIGRHKICPTISPGKSWEGLIASIGGVVLLNVIIMPRLVVAPFVIYASNYKILVLVSVIQTVVAFLGGIFISYLKRKKGLKDTGEVLPGHGGFLDRFDSVFFTVVVLWGIIGIHQVRRSNFYKKTVLPKIMTQSQKKNSMKHKPSMEPASVKD